MTLLLVIRPSSSSSSFFFFFLNKKLNGSSTSLKHSVLAIVLKCLNNLHIIRFDSIGMTKYFSYNHLTYFLQVVAARSMWMQELQKQTKEETGWFSRSTYYSKDRANTLEEDFDPIPGRTFASKHTSSSMATDFETEKYPVESTELQFIDKSVIAEKTVIKTGNKDSLVGPSSKPLVQNFEDDEDEWPEEDSDFGGYSGTAYCMGNEDDISFSDLEDVDDGNVPRKTKIVVSKGFKKSP